MKAVFVPVLYQYYPSFFPSFLPNGTTARGGPCPPLQHASKLLGSLLYPSIRWRPSLILSCYSLRHSRSFTTGIAIQNRDFNPKTPAHTGGGVKQCILA